MKKTLFILFLLPWLCATAQTVSTSAITLRNCYATESHTVATIGCGSYWWNGVEYKTSTKTSKLFTNARGCDSTAYLSLTVEDWTNHITLPSVDVCEADFPYEWKSAKLDKNAEGDKEYTMAGTYTRTFTNYRGCDSVVTLTINTKTTGCRPAGTLPGEFSVSATQKVYFAKGNLQYKASQNGTEGDITHAVAGGGTANGIWRFAEHQWDWVGDESEGNVYENNIKCDNKLGSATYTGWIDLFSFGTSGYVQAPYKRTTGTSAYYQSNIAGTDYDWGVYNAISNGGNKPNQWRTLTKSEWTYLITKRGGNETAASKKFGYATVNGITGIVILPDVWQLPSSCATFVWAVKNYPSGKYTDNVYYTKDHPSYVANTTSCWDDMEDAGALFLPAGGYYYNSYSKISAKQQEGTYHSTSFTPSDRHSTILYFGLGDTYVRVTNPPTGQDYGASGEAVRLVYDVQ